MNGWQGRQVTLCQWTHACCVFKMINHCREIHVDFLQCANECQRGIRSKREANGKTISGLSDSAIGSSLQHTVPGSYLLRSQNSSAVWEECSHLADEETEERGGNVSCLGPKWTTAWVEDAMGRVADSVLCQEEGKRHCQGTEVNWCGGMLSRMGTAARPPTMCRGFTQNVHSSLESAASPFGHLCRRMREMRPEGEGNARSEAKLAECWILDASLSDDRAKKKHQPEISGG